MEEKGAYEVVILGGGVSGCAAAHRLLAGGVPGARIALVEWLPELGGVARSETLPGTGRGGRGDLPTEYSWRVLGADYVVCRSILRDLPADREPPPGGGSRAGPAGGSPATPAANALADWERAGDSWTLNVDAADIAAGSSEEDTDPRSPEGADTGSPRKAAVVHLDRAEGRGVRRVLEGGRGAWRFLAGFWPFISWAERAHLLGRLLYGLTCSRERRAGELGAQTWPAFLAPVPAAAQPFVERVVAPLFGVDMYAASASSVLEYIEGWDTPPVGSRADPFARTLVATRPTSEAWFRPWRRHFEARGVALFTSTAAVRLHARGGCGRGGGWLSAVECAAVGDAMGAEGPARLPHRAAFTLRAAWVICALPAPAAGRLLRAHSCERAAAAPPLAREAALTGAATAATAVCARAGPTAVRLARLGALQEQEMVGAQLFWPQPVALAAPLAGMFLLDTPWQIIILPQAAFWARSHDPAVWGSAFAARYGDGAVRDLWTVTLCDQRRPGGPAARNHPWPRCSLAEVRAEVWVQLRGSASLAAACRGADGGVTWAALSMPRIAIWRSYQPTGALGGGARLEARLGGEARLGEEARLRTWEPKTSPNAGSRALRPRHPHDGAPWRNLLWAGVWAGGPKEMHRMETAASNGFAAAETILAHRAAAEGATTRYTGHGGNPAVAAHRQAAPRAWPWLFGPVRVLDAGCYALGLPHPLRMLPAALLAALAVFLICACAAQ